jgi:hypothetical protein
VHARCDNWPMHRQPSLPPRPYYLLYGDCTLLPDAKISMGPRALVDARFGFLKETYQAQNIPFGLRPVLKSEVLYAGYQQAIAAAKLAPAAS